MITRLNFLQKFKKKNSPNKVLLACYLLLTLLLLINLFWPQNSLDQAKNNVGHWPFSSKKHLSFSQALFINGYFNEAKQEFRQGSNLYKQTRFGDLANQTEKEITKTTTLLSQPEKIQAEIKFWEEILKNKPYYRDVSLHLAILHANLWQITEAREDWQKASYLDPNNELVQKIGGLIN